MTLPTTRRVPDFPVPGRYQLIGYVGRRSQRLHQYATREAAQRVARRVLHEGYSTEFSASYSKVEVNDRINRQVIWAESKPTKHYGR